MRKMLLAVLAFAATLTATAQEHPNGRFERRDSTRIAEPFVLPDTIVHMTPWMPSYDVMVPIGSKPVVSMTSVVLAPKSKLPARVSVFDASPRQLVRHVTISNGQAWNWSPYPDRELDARVIRFPMRDIRELDRERQKAGPPKPARPPK